LAEKQDKIHRCLRMGFYRSMRTPSRRPQKKSIIPEVPQTPTKPPRLQQRQRQSPEQNIPSKQTSPMKIDDAGYEPMDLSQ
jgi:hypothetical protein